LLSQLLAISVDEESGFIIQDRVFNRQEHVQLAISVLDEQLRLHRKYTDNLAKDLAVKTEASSLQRRMKKVNMVSSY